MKEDTNIDELLNSYIDDELPARQRIELQRLISHDEQVERRLHQLEKCRLLISSIPCAEAPAGLVEDVKAAVERKTLIEEPGAVYDRRKGARELLGRRLLAAAAMFGLVAILAAVIYTIVAPETVTTLPVAKQPTEPQQGLQLQFEKSAGAIIAAAEQPVGEQSKDKLRFFGRLELVAKNPDVVSAYLNKTLESSGLLNEVYQGPAASCSVVCSKEQVNQLLADLNHIWDKLDSARLFVGEGKDSQVVVERVTVPQVAEIITQDYDESIKVAKDFAVLNGFNSRMPAGELLAATRPKDSATGGLIDIPMPVLTSGGAAGKTQAVSKQGPRNINLTIMIVEAD
jgi:hypothetical protein